MDPTIVINQRVAVVVIYRHVADSLDAVMPYKMRYQGRDIVFTHLGLRHPTAQGKRMIHIFDVSDGMNDYRLEHDAERLTWTLVAMIPGVA
jgi:hypothetical protein